VGYAWANLIGFCFSEKDLLGFAFDLFDEGLNLVNQYRQIRLTEAHLRRWEAVMFDIWGDVFVMGMGAF